MANYLEVQMQATIERLTKQGWSERRIAQELGVNRRTVSKYRSKCTTGHGGCPPGKGDSKCTTQVPAGKSLPVTHSACEPFQADIEKSLRAGLSAQRIFQDLRSGHGFKGGYDSVKRFVRKLKTVSVLPFRRMEQPFGEEVQVDYASGYWLTDERGRQKKVNVLRVVLSASRKGYSEASYSQDTESFLRGLENAFRAFGGVPKTVVIDNLKSGVIKADFYDPELNPKLRDFAEHYGCCILPSRVRTPRHKGKVENSVKYVQDNALRGKRFASLGALNRHLRQWESGVADQRIHGTVRRQVQDMFEEERPHLQPLPATLFEVFEESKRKVHRDGHIEVAGSYYSVPPEYIRREVWVRYNARTVRVYDLRMHQIAVHARVEPGRFSTRREDIPKEKISNPERGNEWLLRRLEYLGPEVSAWAQAMLQNRGIPGTRVLNGLYQLAQKHSAEDLRKACRIALKFGDFHLNGVKRHLVARPSWQPQFRFTSEHPLIRPVEQYENIVNTREVFDA